MSCEWVSRGAIAPDLPERIDGCRESEVSRECLTDDTVCWLYNRFNALEEPWPEGCNGSAQRAPLPRCGVLPHTSCGWQILKVWIECSCVVLRASATDKFRNTRPTEPSVKLMHCGFGKTRCCDTMVHMLPTNTTKIEITQETRQKLLSERDRTSLKQGTILTYAKRLGLLPKDCRLNAGIIQNWFEGTASSAYEDEIDAIMTAYESVVLEVDLPPHPHECQFVLIDDILAKELHSLLNGSRQGGRRFILRHGNAPNGLNGNRILRLAKGRDAHIQVNHLRFIRQAFAID